LIATLFRLSLNVAATRLILSDADAGRVIGSVGSYVVGGNYVIGLIVFLILVVVQYVVVTSGAQRVSEVAARFTLDSMPGQQMSIDADLNMGFIDQDEAQRRRKRIEKEAAFYGAMDGASKFVKGDAIAGIVILVINIVGGLIIGVMQMGLKWGDALHTYLQARLPLTLPALTSLVRWSCRSWVQANNSGNTKRQARHKATGTL
jgi:flagellar biosynthesis protein FlhA